MTTIELWVALVIPRTPVAVLPPSTSPRQQINGGGNRLVDDVDVPLRTLNPDRLALNLWSMTTRLALTSVSRFSLFQETFFSIFLDVYPSSFSCMFQRARKVIQHGLHSTNIFTFESSSNLSGLRLLSLFVLAGKTAAHQPSQLGANG